MSITKQEKQLSINKWQWYYDHPESNELSEDLEIQSSIYWNECVLCEEFELGTGSLKQCYECPVCIKEKVNCFNEKSSFYKWDNSLTSKTRKKYAGKLLEIMKSLEVKK
jgi:hypothetical protein